MGAKSQIRNLLAGIIFSTFTANQKNVFIHSSSPVPELSFLPYMGREERRVQGLD